MKKILKDLGKTKVFDSVVGELNAEEKRDTVQKTEPTYQKKSTPRKHWRSMAVLAACCGMLITVGNTYADAVHQHQATPGLVQAGLSPDGIWVIDQDMKTGFCPGSHTARMFKDFIADQRTSTPVDAQNSQAENFDYEYRIETQWDEETRSNIATNRYFEKYVDGKRIWSVSIDTLTDDDILYEGYSDVGDSVIIFGRTMTQASYETSYAWMAKIDYEGNVAWYRKLDNGFQNETIHAILKNEDGTYAVFGRGDFEYLCLSQYDTNGNRKKFSKTEIGNYGIWNAARFGDGYILQLVGFEEQEKIVKVDMDAHITDEFSYTGTDRYYYITDMIEFNGKLYLSAYTVPKDEAGEQGKGKREEIASIFEYLVENNLFLSSAEEELPTLLREHYTAMLLVCDPNSGTPQEFYSVKGSLGGEIAVNSNNLVWDVESIVSAKNSPYTSAFSIVGDCSVFRYTFDETSTCIKQEETGETTGYLR